MPTTAKVLDAPQRPASELELRLAMEREASRLSNLILTQPAKPLIGYIWAQRTLGEASANDAFLLHYVHAVLSSHASLPGATLSEDTCAEIVACAQSLRDATQAYCDALAANGLHAAYEAASGWVSQGAALDGDFLTLVLGAHDEALQRRHGIGSADIVKRLIAIPVLVRTIQGRAAAAIEAQIEGVDALARQHGLDLQEAAALWSEQNPGAARAAARASADLLEAGLCNLSAHTDLPVTLLRDLAFEGAGHSDFYAPGPFRGTPLRTLPARVRPLLKLAGDHFVADPDLLGGLHRPILAGLIGNDAKENEAFAARFNAASRTAFARALPAQLEGARIDTGVCYRDVETHQWAENDCLVRLGDTLMLVDAQAGAAATIAPPATDLEQHVADVREIVTHAYEQCRCFFDYLASAPEVPLFRREGGRYVEFDRVRLADFRRAFPIGLTLERLSPHVALCRASEGIAPLIGRYSFMMMSAEDLLMLGRALPAREDFVRYMEFRQADAIRNHEAEHLAAFQSRPPDPVVTSVDEIEMAEVVMPEPQNENVAQTVEVIEPSVEETAATPAVEVIEPVAEPESDEGIDDGIVRPAEIAHLLGAPRTTRSARAGRRSLRISPPCCGRPAKASRRRNSAGCMWRTRRRCSSGCSASARAPTSRRSRRARKRRQCRQARRRSPRSWCMRRRRANTRVPWRCRLPSRRRAAPSMRDIRPRLKRHAPMMRTHAMRRTPGARSAATSRAGAVQARNSSAATGQCRLLT